MKLNNELKRTKMDVRQSLESQNANNYPLSLMLTNIFQKRNTLLKQLIFYTLISKENKPKNTVVWKHKYPNITTYG